MGIPAFLTEKDNKILFNEEGEFLFYVSEAFFVDTKLPLAQINGQYVNMVGICDWAIVMPNGKVTDAKRFYLPTIFICKPNRIEKVKNLKLSNSSKAIDYRILHFKKGDEVISNINIPKTVDTAELIFKSFLINSNKIPPSVPYDKLQDYLVDSLRITGNDYGITKQLFGIVIGESCRNPKDLSEPFRYTKMADMKDYKQLDMASIPKYISPYTAITSENYDESLMSAVMMSELPDEEIKPTPLEKVVML